LALRASSATPVQVHDHERANELVQSRCQRADLWTTVLGPVSSAMARAAREDGGDKSIVVRRDLMSQSAVRLGVRDAAYTSRSSGAPTTADGLVGGGKAAKRVYAKGSGHPDARLFPPTSCGSSKKLEMGRSRDLPME
jgi:hypothetical protein